VRSAFASVEQDLDDEEGVEETRVRASSPSE
jgi:hypothetical protein